MAYTDQAYAGDILRARYVNKETGFIGNPTKFVVLKQNHAISTKGIVVKLYRRENNELWIGNFKVIDKLIKPCYN